MKIGYSVEGSTDRALINGLRDRWCPRATLEEGQFRGNTGARLRDEYEQICLELAYKGVDVMVFLTDANGAKWRKVQENELRKFPDNEKHRAIHGVADRNVECWLCLDPDWLLSVCGSTTVARKQLTAKDPKNAFSRLMGIDRDKKEEEIAALLQDAPLKTWHKRSTSFRDFYEQCHKLSQRMGCAIENILDLDR